MRWVIGYGVLRHFQQYLNYIVHVLPRLETLTRNKLALKVASLTMICSARLAGDCHCLRLNEVIICQEHVVLCTRRAEHIVVKLATFNASCCRDNYARRGNTLAYFLLE
jgi:hypothetical protein